MKNHSEVIAGVLTGGTSSKFNASAMAEVMAEVDAVTTAATISEKEERTALLAQKFNSTLLSLDRRIEKKASCFEYEGKSLCTLGNIFGVKGQQGSRKTFFVAALAGAWLSGGEALGFRATLAKEKRGVLWFDTEQDKDDAHTTMQRACAIAGMQKHPANLIFSSLREYTAKERIELLEYAITQDGLGLIVIDGITDMLLTSPNNEVESNELVQKLMTLSTLHQVCILVVIHENIGNATATGGKSRGHLGSEIERKAQAMIAISIDSETPTLSKVTITKARKMIRPEPFGFWINEQTGLPQLDTADAPAPYQERAVKVTKAQRNADKAMQAIKPYLELKREATQAEILKKIMTSCSVQDKTAREILNELVSKEELTKGKGGAKNANIIALPLL